MQLIKFIKIFFLIVLFLFPQNFLSQSNLSVIEAHNEFTVENITVSNGLYNNYIFDVLQDHLGFLWLASDIGLQKFDGYTFLLYVPDSSSVTSRKVLGLYEDKKGNLWIQMKESLFRYERELDDFVKFCFVNERNDTIPYEVSAITEDLDGTLWVWILDKGLYKVGPENRTFVPNSKVNKWFQAVKKPVILKEGNIKGLYETEVTFPSGYYGLELQYKFLIKRKDGTLEWEPSPNPDNPSRYGNRFLTLSGDTVILPVVSFNNEIRIEHKNIEPINKLNIKPTVIKFNLDLNKFDYSLLEGEEVQIRGDRLPLMWDDNIEEISMTFDMKNNLWIALGSLGLFQFNIEDGIYKEFVANSKIPGTISNNFINAAICDQNGELWFGTSSGLSKYYADKNLFENYFIDPSNPWNTINIIYRMTDDGEGNIWTISSNNVNGFGRFNKLKKEFTHYSKGMSANISSVTTDRSGIVWLGNWYQGIYKVDPNSKKFSAFSIKRNGNDILDGKIITPVYEDQNGEIWFGGNLDGLYRYNKQTGKISLYKIEGGNFDSSVENYILDIFQDSKGNFWIGTSGGLCFFNSENGNFKHIQQPNSVYEGLGRTSKIIEDSNGILWIVTLNGFLVQLDPETYRTEYFTMNGRQLKFTDLIADEQGFLYIGSAMEGGEGAVLKYDLSKKELSFVKQLDKFNIASFCYDNGILWCGSIDAGIIRYDIKADTKNIVSTNNGLISNSILGLETDGSGNIWLSSPRGLTRYNPGNETFNHYFKEDGFFTNEFTYKAHFKSQNGDMIFGSIRGIVKFNPDSIKNSEYLPPIVLTDLKVENKSIGVGKNSPLNKHISIIDIIELPHDKNDIAITFASMDFRHPERIKYSFYLENFEDDWRTPALERTAYYTNLDPGEYIFKVKGTNSDGVWNDEGASIKIIVVPPWWQTWWAYTIYICFFLGLLYFIRRYELNRQNLKYGLELKRVEMEKYQEIDIMKSRFFANISHEFRTPLTLLLGPVEHILLKSSDKDIIKKASFIKRNSNRLLQLVNQLLDLSKLDSGKLKMEASQGNIVTYIKRIALSFESLTESKDIILKIKSSNDLIEVYFDREKMMKIISNLLSNAFKFTPVRGNVLVRITEASNNTAEIKIRNTGIGIEQEVLPRLFDRFYQVNSSHTKEHGGTGIGLALTKELIELHHGSITVDSEINKWTEFTINLPLGREHLKDEEIATTDETVDTNEILLVEEEYYNIQTKAESDVFSDESKTMVLVVEDNYDMREYIKESLSDIYEVDEAVNGEQGVRIAEKTIPDLIISDLMMPKMDGNELTRILKNDERTSHIPIIILTAKSGQENKIEGLETGADDYLTKPFDLQELRVRVENLISIRKKLQEKFSKGDYLYKPSGEKIKSIDEKFLAKVVGVIENHLSEEEFSIEECSSEVGMSRTHLYKKIKALIGKSPSQYVRSVRLNYAKKMVEEGKGNISEIAYSVGFSSPAYFSRCFKEEFGYPPSNILS